MAEAPKNSIAAASARASEVTQQRKSLLAALISYVRSNGGFITSVPGAKLVRIEISKDSSLPVKLRELGYNPIQCGTTMRTTGEGLVLSDVIEVSLSGK